MLLISQFLSKKKTDDNYRIITAHNSTQGLGNGPLEPQIQATRALWQSTFGKNFNIGYTRMLGKLIDTIFGMLGPMLIQCGILSVVPLLITQPILDIRGDVRTYMISCTLTLIPYWLATFIIDIIIWTVITFFVWIFICCMFNSIIS